MEINKCPKCGCDADIARGTRYNWESKTRHPFYYVCCDNCGTRGVSDYKDPEEAVCEWNDGEVTLSGRELYDVYMEVGFYKHFYVWADSKAEAEHRIEEAIEAGKVEFTDIAPGSLEFHNWGPTSPEYDPERYQREVLNPEDKNE